MIFKFLINIYFEKHGRIKNIPLLYIWYPYDNKSNRDQLIINRWDKVVQSINN